MILDDDVKGWTKNNNQSYICRFSAALMTPRRLLGGIIWKDPFVQTISLLMKQGLRIPELKCPQEEQRTEPAKHGDEGARAW